MPGFDLLVRSARVFPGDGPGLVTDVAVAGARIAAVGPGLPTEHAREVVDGDGLMLCPGFIDLHAHSALQPFHDPRLLPKVAQGFTTELINPDGLAPAPVDPSRTEDRRDYLRAIEGPGPERWTWSTVEEYLEALDMTRPATGLVPSIGHSAVRDRVIGGTARGATREEIRAIRDEVRRGLEAGARSLSLGLVYAPGMFAETEELVELAGEAARFGAPLAVHVRNEAAGVLQAVNEVVEVARRSGAPLHLSHLKVIGNRELVGPLLDLVETAMADVDLTFDQYPYGAGTSMLAQILPPWAQDGGSAAILGRLGDAAERWAIAHDVAWGLPGWENLYGNLGPDSFVIARAGPPRENDTGKTLARLGDERGADPLGAALELMLDTKLDVTTIERYAEEATVREIFQHPLALVGSDAIFSTRPHPRLHGTAARVLGRYALRERLIPVQDAVARLTSRPAGRLGLRDRGAIRAGLRADLVLVDPDRFVDTATYDDPIRYPEGVVRVVVGGRTVWDQRGATGETPGGVVARRSY
jgi:N-acyl-D-amino-acid deacylase